jgi:acryloyl-coenzyme A reductase
MKAIIIKDRATPEGLHYGTLDDPTPTGRNVLVKVRACGVCRRDTLIRKDPPRGVHQPHILGHEIAGDVVALGPDAMGLKIGDRVVSTQRAYVCGQCNMCRTGRETLCANLRFLGLQAMGGYAELVLVNDDNLCLLPASVDYVIGSIVGCPIGTAYNAVCDTGVIRAGERVLITGMGGVGTHAVQIARALGAFTIAATRSAGKVELLKELGANEVIVAPDGQFADGVRRAAGGDGVDAVIDTLGGVAFHQVIRAVMVGGRIVLVGDVVDKPFETKMTSIYRRGLNLLSAVSTSRRQLDLALRLVATGKVKPLVERTMPLANAAEAHKLIEANKVTGRIVLVP